MSNSRSVMTAAYFHRKTTTAAVTAAPTLMYQRIQSRRISTSIRSMVVMTEEVSSRLLREQDHADRDVGHGASYSTTCVAASVAKEVENDERDGHAEQEGRVYDVEMEPVRHSSPFVTSFFQRPAAIPAAWSACPGPCRPPPHDAPDSTS